MSGSAVFPGAGPTRRLLLLLALAALGAAAGTPARAQAPADGHWLPWLGCWEPTGTPEQPNTARGAGLCIHANAGAPGVSFATIAGGKVVAEHEIVADGTRHNVSEGGCTGWESARWSSDGRRLVRRTELDCGGAPRAVSGVLFMQPDSRWTDIEAAGTPGNMGIQVVHYRPMTFTAATATGLMPRGQDLAIQTSRTAAAAPLDIAAVVEASRQLDARVVQALVYERGNGYALDGRTLARLADERVPTDVIDLMVALTYPDFFSIGGPAGKLALRADSTPPSGGRGGYGGGGGPGWGCYSYGFNPWGYGYPYWMAGYGYGSNYPYGYGYGYPYGGYGYPYGYGGYDPCFGGYGGGWGGYWGGGYWGYPSGGVVIIKNPGEGGKVVKGEGYTPPSGGGTSTGRTAHPRGGSGATAHPSTGSSGGSGGSKGGSSGGSNPSRGGDSSGGSSSGRTAHPRNQTSYQPPSAPEAPRVIYTPPPSYSGGGSTASSAPVSPVSSSVSAGSDSNPSRGGDSAGGTDTGRTAHPR